MEARSQDRAFCFLVRGISGVSTQPAQVLGLKQFTSRASDGFRLKDEMRVVGKARDNSAMIAPSASFSRQPLQHNIGTFRDGGFRQYNRLIIQTGIVVQQALIFLHCHLETMLALAVASVDLRPGRGEENQRVIAVRVPQRFDEAIAAYMVKC